MSPLLPFNDRLKQIPLILVFVFSSWLSFGQQKPQEDVLKKVISVNLNNKTLKEVLDQIATTSKVSVMYGISKELTTSTVSIHAKNKTLKEVLDEVLSKFPFTYQVISNKIIITHQDKLPDHSLPTGKLNPIKGKVIDAQGIVLSGATIKIKDGNIFAITDDNGEFILQNVTSGIILQISFIGFKTSEVSVTSDSDYLSIIMEADNSKLSEVNVVSNGYQDIPAERATGSFSQPMKEEFNARVSPDVLSKLSGITSGLIFNANTTASKTGLDINIRGRSTIFANDQPLIVVDNFPYSGNINNINPNDVESVTVLKDAAAASIWGVRAGNGVIVITTKKGRLNQPLKVGFNANLTVFNKPDLNYNPNQLDASSYIVLEQFLFGKGYYDSSLTNTTTYPVISPAVQLLAANRSGTLSASDLNTQLNILRGYSMNDQFGKYFYQKTTNQQYALNLSGGSSKALYYFSAGYDNGLASAKDNVNKRITINSQNTFFLAKNLELNAGLNIVQANAQSDNTLASIQSRGFFPYTQFADANGNPLSISYQYNQSFVQSAQSKGFLDWSYVPLKELGSTDNATEVVDIRLSTGLKYTIINGLSAQVKYQYESTNSQLRLYQSQQTYFTRNYINQFSVLTAGKVTGYNVPLGGVLTLNNGKTIANNVRGTLNYNYAWKDNSVTALAGYELSQTTGDANSSIMYGYNDDLATFTYINPLTTFPTNPSGSTTINGGLGINSTLVRLRSSFANVAYTYKDRYRLSGSARVDGSNYFGVATNQKSVPLWSAGAKWDIDKEPFYKLEWLPVLAFRTSYGYNGNLIQSITGVTTFRYTTGATYTALPYAQTSNIGNPDLRWEKTGIANLAVDFESKNNAVTGSLDYYFKRETDLLGFKSFPENSGITSLEGNYADMQGQGFDLSLTTRNLNGGLKWYTTLLFSHATDKVTRYDITPLSNQLVGTTGSGAPNIGKPVFGIYAYKWGGLDPATGSPIGFVNGQPSQNYTAITTNTPLTDLEYLGPARPTYFGGLNNRFSYKGFSLTFQINYKLGYYFIKPVMNYTSIGSGGNAFLKVNKDYNNRWQSPGDEKNTNVPSLIYPFTSARDQFYQYSTVNVLNADHIRLQDISLSYDFNKSVYHKLPFTNLQLFAYANNVAILWKANKVGLDPDAVPATTDNQTMPTPRSIAIGIKGNF